MFFRFFNSAKASGTKMYSANKSCFGLVAAPSYCNFQQKPWFNRDKKLSITFEFFFLKIVSTFGTQK